MPCACDLSGQDGFVCVGLAEAMAKEMRHEVAQQERTFPKAYHHLRKRDCLRLVIKDIPVV